MHPRATVGMPQANPRAGMPRLRRSWRRRLRPAPTVRAQPVMCASNKGQGWSLVYLVNDVAVEAFKATTSGSKMMYGQIYWYLNVNARPQLPDGFHGWLPRCGTEHLGQTR